MTGLERSADLRDEMTPLERFSLLLIDEQPDRVVRLPIVTAHAGAVAGIPVGRTVKDGLLMARAQFAAQERYGHDAYTVFSEVGILAEAMGSKYAHREWDVPILEEPVVKRPEDLKLLSVPTANDGRLPVYVNAVKALHSAKGDRIPVFCLIPAPFTTAAGLRGVEDFLVDVLTDPDFAHSLLDLAERAAYPILEAVVLAGGLPCLVDPLASASVTSPAVFRDFALPGTRRLIEYLHRMDLDVPLHICGETGPILEDIAASGADLFSFDKTPIPEVREAVGDRVRLVGNVSPSLMLSGTAAEAAEAATRAVGEGLGTPKGFVVSTGCELPVRTPPENVEAFQRAALMAGGAR